MNYPDCPSNTPDKCRFTNEGGTCTLMHSPLVYDREGRVVGGGSNIRTSGILCYTCGNRWASRATELEDAQGKPRQWAMVEPAIAKHTFLVVTFAGISQKYLQTASETPSWVDL